jgi:SH3-like domain-containing protein
MYDLPRRTLCKLIIKHGPALHADPKRTEAFLRDLCGEHVREIFVLVNAQKQRVPADLLAAPAWMPQQVLQAQLVRRLEENLALTHEAAEWAVAAWAEALRIGPNPPDRIWIWLRQYTSPALSARHGRPLFASIYDKILPLARRLFAWIVIQWQALPSRLSRLGLLVLHTGQWIWQRRERLSRPPVLIPLTLIFCVSIALASATPTPLSVPAATETAGLLAAYPLPRRARVNVELLTIRSKPSTEAEVIGMLFLGQEVRAVDFSADGGWSQIEAPAPGWVSNEFLYFRSDAPPNLDVRLVLADGVVVGEYVNIRQGPGTDYAVADTLVIGQAVVIIAATLDGGWWQIAAPVQGWVSADLVHQNLGDGN